MNILCKVQTRRNFTHKKKKKKKRKKKGKDKEEKQKDKKLANGWRLEILSNTHLPLFLFHFLSILWKLNFGGSEEEIIGSHHFSLPIPLSIKHPFHPFSPLFFILPKIHSTKVKKIYSQIFNPQDCFFNLFTLLNFLKSFTFHNFSFFLSRFARGLNLENIALVL